ncbi:alkaline phosphatase D family protein [Saccharothrix algeriensis]|uniref:Alkaline phosphatase family protein n=1 Tax=Saccharothrix algeriensis TaxID=173560 RepID=A0A8T8I490_9PSEU|nr:alkaline phosphatase D family protein [Saccharothrix algeriensis]MBM7810756.1 phosphodiesterase/alkaline phosphatase D-like protein [Saccharothrix algeriensis]QTR04804.1 alkaline phosphatase family protein [Saccharothrix algeriensis]
MADLVLGPVLRHVDPTSATVWVETDTACEVEVAGHRASTFRVGDQHFALLVVEGLEPGTTTPYDVRLDGRVAWPEPGSSFPEPRIRTGPVRRLVFGSCRAAKEGGPDQRAADKRGSDALDAFALRMKDWPEERWPDALLLLGDQVYADEPTERVKRWLAERRPEPEGEVVSFREYAELYHESWADPEIRWLMSVLPTSMIFDDHDIRDDWNTSRAWRAQMAEKPWWRKRIRAGLASYWVYQHLGNLAPEDLAQDELYGQVLAAGGDVQGLLEDFAERADQEADGRKPTRWSYRRDFGRVRLLVVDTRSGRILDGPERLMVGDEEFDWIERNAEGDVDHLLIGSSLPWLMPHALSHLQSIVERGAERPGRRGRLAEQVRQVGDLEHWPAFRASFERLARFLHRVGSGPAAPGTICVLSGDVHHSYAARADFADPTASRVLQLVCSPVHNDPPWIFRPVFRLSWSRPLARLLRRWADRAGVPADPVSWTKISGPHFGNSVAVLEIAGREARYRLETAGPDGLAHSADLTL